jgi:hypothetical protein
MDDYRLPSASFGYRPPVTRRLAVLLASLALVFIGTVEASESARQLSDVATRPVLRAEGVGLSALGFAASALVYLALGWWCAVDRTAIRLGALTGAIAGLVGGAIRATLIADPVRTIVARYAALPEWFIPAVLVIFVVIQVTAAAVGGAALAFAGVRLARVGRTRPRS